MKSFTDAIFSTLSVFFIIQSKAPKVLWEKSTSRPRKELRYVYLSRPKVWAPFCEFDDVTIYPVLVVAQTGYDFKRFINFANVVQLVSLDSQATVPFIPFRQTLPAIRSLLRKRAKLRAPILDTKKNPLLKTQTSKQTKQKQGF